MALCYLAGGSYLDMRCLCGVSESSFYRGTTNIFQAIVTAPELKIRNPMSVAERRETDHAFAARSNYELNTGVLGCIDG